MAAFYILPPSHLQIGLRDAQVAVPPPVLRELSRGGAGAVGERGEVAGVSAAQSVASPVDGEALEDSGGLTETGEGQVDFLGGGTGQLARGEGTARVLRAALLVHLLPRRARVEEVVERRGRPGACAGGCLAGLPGGHGGVAEDGGPREGQGGFERDPVPGLLTLGLLDADVPGGVGLVDDGSLSFAHDAVLGAGEEGDEEEAGDQGDQAEGGRHRSERGGVKSKAKVS